MPARTTRDLYLQIIERSREPVPGGIGSWSRQFAQLAENVGRISDAALGGSKEGVRPTEAVGVAVVERGVYRCNGSQHLGRPDGFTEEMWNQLHRVLSEMDADLMDPATASAVIQVGLYREVRYR